MDGRQDTAKVSSVEYKVYTDVSTAYTDIEAGNVDVVRRIPADASDTAPTEFGDRYLEDVSSSFTYLGLPTYDRRFADKRVRQALSMGIDRQAIATAIFHGTRTPATSVIAPTIDGHRADACVYCHLDVAAAKHAPRRGALQPQQAGRAVVQLRCRAGRLDGGGGQ